MEITLRDFLKQNGGYENIRKNLLIRAGDTYYACNVLEYSSQPIQRLLDHKLWKPDYTRFDGVRVVYVQD